jgi:hypothetical protein
LAGWGRLDAKLFQEAYAVKPIAVEQTLNHPVKNSGTLIINPLKDHYTLESQPKNS